MAASDILSLRVSMGERAIRILYAIALILIAFAVLFGLWRGVMLTTRAPMAPPAVQTSANTNPPAAAPQAQAPEPGFQGMRMGPRFYGRFEGRRFFMMRHHPVQAGIFIIVASLIRGFIAVLVVRVLAEMGLAVLAMPRRT